MRELRNCDFCDGDAAGTFEIVPPGLEPTEAEQRRVVLCPDCRERLEGLLEPLLARARDGGAAGGAEPNATDDERSDGGSSAAIAPPSADAAEPGPADADGDSDTDTADSSLEDGITFERDEGGSDTESAVDTAGDDGSTAADAADAADSELDRGDDRDGTATARPAAYAKVVRLLRNREFPMDRRAVEDLAAGAYDLEDREVEAIVDHAVEEGEFVEKGDTLRRP
ncbi:hypothetical protein A6E15_16275 [Natrinema saccharevitans]|uniref:Uncharacterized protein n=1 Tax=Natrinema saccharevitans TaxID=301967 RepID=A0A1S8B1E0_9EURY|nr:hypothetical protein [Natrinema saccharevitans]OLZ42424.1 hypothetical protein A6E15_16275 [Natrinema saccharevitans]